MAEGSLGGTPISQLPPSSFAYCEPGDGAVSTRCHFPIRDKNGKPDAAHVRNALARLATSEFESKARRKVEAAARELGIGAPAGKAFTDELKAEPFDTGQYDRWLKGAIPRRILMLPYDGPLPRPTAPRGVDLDGEWFSPRTDLYDGKAMLLATRQRVVDWHHDQVPPTGPKQNRAMKGAIVGHLIFDEEPEDDGIWADWWANAGEQRMKLIERLEKMPFPLFGSSKAAYKVTDEDTGEILKWPLIAHTISTSPQNTRAVVPPLKAVLTSPNLADVPAEALKALLAGLDADEVELLLSFPYGGGDEAAKAGRVLSASNEAALRDVLESLVAFLQRTVKEQAAATE